MLLLSAGTYIFLFSGLYCFNTIIKIAGTSSHCLMSSTFWLLVGQFGLVLIYTNCQVFPTMIFTATSDDALIISAYFVFITQASVIICFIYIYIYIYVVVVVGARYGS